jgi:AraC-like DNA-binding protein
LATLEQKRKTAALMDYREHAVPALFRRHVECVWRLRSRAAGLQTIFPDGRCELIVHFAQTPRIQDAEQGWQEQARVLFAAQHRAALRLDTQGELDCLGIRLTPAASAAVVGAQLSQLQDRVVDLSLVTSDFADALAEAAAGFCADPESVDLWALLESRVLSYRIDERIERAVTRLEAPGANDRISTIAADLAMSIRAFQMRFLECVGLRAKEFAQIARLQAMIRSLDAEAGPLSQIASEAGFADQPHATRELSRFAGTTPALLRAALQRGRYNDDTVQLAAAFVRGHA